ncbi:hypothetical protein D9M72_629240 [compost metagenome]
MSEQGVAQKAPQVPREFLVVANYPSDEPVPQRAGGCRVVCHGGAKRHSIGRSGLTPEACAQVDHAILDSQQVGVAVEGAGVDEHAREQLRVVHDGFQAGGRTETAQLFGSATTAC